jgi:NAD(P)-dependent dehydrogenase (short-subunit alcohol dehydrogenase family)
MGSRRAMTTLVNVAAAVTPDGTVETLPLEEWNRAISVNLTGAFLMCKYAVPQMRRAGGGSIINIASQLGHLGVPLRSPYCTTKAALLHFTRILAMDHAVDRIRANTISPGFILTERSSRRSGGKEQARAKMGPHHLLNRPGEPEDIAAGAVYLASDDSCFVTATELFVGHWPFLLASRLVSKSIAIPPFIVALNHSRTVGCPAVVLAAARFYFDVRNFSDRADA